MNVAFFAARAFRCTARALSAGWRISAMAGNVAPPWSTAIATPGAMPSATRSIVVEMLAAIAMLAVTTKVSIAIEPPITHVREIPFDMMSILLRIGVDAVGMRGACGIDGAFMCAAIAGR